MTPDEARALMREFAELYDVLVSGGVSDHAGDIIEMCGRARSAADALAVPKWSREVPTEPGFYWHLWRLGGVSELSVEELKRVVLSNGEVLSFWEDDAFNESSGGYFLPIPVPALPEDIAEAIARHREARRDIP